MAGASCRTAECHGRHELGAAKPKRPMAKICTKKNERKIGAQAAIRFVYWGGCGVCLVLLWLRPRPGRSKFLPSILSVPDDRGQIRDKILGGAACRGRWGCQEHFHSYCLMCGLRFKASNAQLQPCLAPGKRPQRVNRWVQVRAPTGELHLQLRTWNPTSAPNHNKLSTATATHLEEQRSSGLLRITSETKLIPPN